VRSGRRWALSGLDRPGVGLGRGWTRTKRSLFAALPPTPRGAGGVLACAAPDDVHPSGAAREARPARKAKRTATEPEGLGKPTARAPAQAPVQRRRGLGGACVGLHNKSFFTRLSPSFQEATILKQIRHPVRVDQSRKRRRQPSKLAGESGAARLRADGEAEQNQVACVQQRTGKVEAGRAAGRRHRAGGARGREQRRENALRRAARAPSGRAARSRGARACSGSVGFSAPHRKLCVSAPQAAGGSRSRRARGAVRAAPG
jgi:hypothetical protein